MRGWAWGQKQVDICEFEFQDSEGYEEKSFLKKTRNQKPPHHVTLYPPLSLLNPISSRSEREFRKAPASDLSHCGIRRL